MVTVNGTNHNGYVNGTNGHTLICDSDYEPRPVIVITPSKPTPGWRDQLAPYTHCLQWSDSDGCSHSMTLRADTLEQLLADLKLIKQGIKIAKEKAKEKAKAQQPVTQPDPDSDVPPCKVHGTPMVRKQSRRTGEIYFSHALPNGELCFGREKKA